GVGLAGHACQAHHARHGRARVVVEHGVADPHLVAHEVARLVVAHAVPHGAALALELFVGVAVGLALDQPATCHAPEGNTASAAGGRLREGQGDDRVLGHAHGRAGAALLPVLGVHRPHAVGVEGHAPGHRGDLGAGGVGRAGRALLHHQPDGRHVGGRHAHVDDVVHGAGALHLV